MTISWLRFTWNLEKLPTGEPEVPAPYILRFATSDEEAVIQQTVASAFRMDSGWGDVQKLLLEVMSKNVSRAFEKGGKHRCLILLHGTRVIGASVVCIDPEADNHLPTGPCILHEYGSRGLGSLLLQVSLATLKEAGLKRAHGITREKTTGARFIFPKSGGTSVPWNMDIEVPFHQAA